MVRTTLLRTMARVEVPLPHGSTLNITGSFSVSFVLIKFECSCIINIQVTR
jgi:hypothetical protein